MGEVKPCNNLEQVIRKYGHRVQSFAFVYLKNKADAEDVAQDVFLTYYTKAPRFLSAQKEKAWLLKVAANRCLSLLRKSGMEELPLTEGLCELPQEESDVLQAVMDLEEKYRVPIHLHYYEGYSIGEIAKILRIPYGTVGSYLFRGREKLKLSLEEDDYET